MWPKRVILKSIGDNQYQNIPSSVNTRKLTSQKKRSPADSVQYGYPHILIYSIPQCPVLKTYIPVVHIAKIVRARRVHTEIVVITVKLGMEPLVEALNSGVPGGLR